MSINKNKTFYDHVKSRSTKREAWLFFLRRSLREENFCEHDDHARVVEERKREVDSLRVGFEQRFGSLFESN